MSGRALRGGRDTVPLPNAMVVLHRVTREGGGPIDSVRTDARGRYRFLLRAPDTTSMYVVNVWYDSLAYFSLPLQTAGRSAAHVEDLVAYPSTAGAPPIELARRLATIAGAGEDGTRQVLEIVELQNRGPTTRITLDENVPSWAGRVPEGAAQFQPGQGDISPEAMIFKNDSVVVLGPIPPGGVKQLSYSYSVPAGTRKLVLPIDQATTELNLLLEDTLAVVTGPGIEALGVNELEERRFAAYRARGVPAGSRVEIDLPAGKFRAQALLPYIIAVLAAAMVLALVWALKRRPLAPQGPPP